MIEYWLLIIDYDWWLIDWLMINWIMIDLLLIVDLFMIAWGLIDDWWFIDE